MVGIRNGVRKTTWANVEIQKHLEGMMGLLPRFWQMAKDNLSIEA